MFIFTFSLHLSLCFRFIFIVVSFKQCVFPIWNINFSIQRHKFLCIHFVLASVQHSSISHGAFIKVKRICLRMSLNGHFSLRFNLMKTFGFSVEFHMNSTDVLLFQYLNHLRSILNEFHIDTSTVSNIFSC